MSKIRDFDLSREHLELQDFADDVQRLINNGNFEIDVTNASEPAFDAPVQTKFVFSVFGGQIRLYISFQGNWYYTPFTLL